MTVDLIMMPTSPGRKISNIGASVRKHRHIVLQLISLHALTGYDSLSAIYGCKVKTVKMRLKGHLPPTLGDENIDIYIRYLGACNGCASSATGTLYAIESTLKEKLSKNIRVLPI